MANEAWLNGKLDGFAPIVMPAAHALTQAAADLRRHAADLNGEELTTRPNGASSAAFHLRHIAGSIDRLLTYARGEQLNAAQFDFLRTENDDDPAVSAAELTEQAIDRINLALGALENISEENLYEERFVGREKLPTNVFGLLFHIAEHTARHVGQVVTTARIVRKSRNKPANERRI